MPFEMPSDVLNLIEQYANIKFECKKYKYLTHSRRCKITKIHYICHLCHKSKNKHNFKKYSHYSFKCKKHFYCHSTLDKEIYYTRLFRSNWKNILKYNRVVAQLHFLYKPPFLHISSLQGKKMIAKYICNNNNPRVIMRYSHIF